MNQPATTSINRVLPIATQALRAPKTSELVANRLRNSIIRGEFNEGDSLPIEADLMALFSVSRQTLREALRILESEALIRISRGANGGPKVMAPQAETVVRHFGLMLQYQETTLADVFEARLLIEPQAARLVTERAREQAPQRLRMLIHQEEQVLADDIAFAQATIRFHEALVDLAENRTLALMLRTINGVFERHLSLVTLSASQKGDNSEDKKLGLRAQSKLARLIESGDGAAAEEFWRRNLMTINKVLLRQYQFDRIIDLIE